MRPLVAVRRYCLECTASDAKEVRLCPSDSCVLHPFRMAKNPQSGSRLKLRTIRSKCIDCSETLPEIKECGFTDCSLYKFRMAKNPNIILTDKRRKQLSEAAKYMNEHRTAPRD